ncbi:unnamed protein product, partial [Cuscuta europaea]
MILNNNETLRSDEARKRLIFTTTPCRVLEENQLTTPTTRSKRFFDVTRAQFAKMALPKVRNMDLFIFPVQQSGRSYMMTFDLKYNKFFIIDICDAEISIKMKYLSQPNHLKSAVLKRLRDEKHPQAEKVKSMKPEVFKMAWRNKNNKANEGLYVMRHMETFNGESDWDFGLFKDNEKPLNIMRVKYLHKMLTFQKNEV